MQVDLWHWGWRVDRQPRGINASENFVGSFLAAQDNSQTTPSMHAA